ncbi:hypothetical protein ABZ498_11390 [Streptomyces lavendulocolor]|uniref:hypothetical protein n=1 Tax=Streptomyces lavendulocolor TaxID=67316 RepID=UPI0033F4A2AB
MSGEKLHAKGEEGARRARYWLDSTTRANARWVNPHPVAVPKLTFQWADGSNFSYDLGGHLLGGEFEGQEFLVESKFYDSIGHQGAMYVEYLAKCYRAFDTRPDRCDNFMWITWHPSSLKKWARLCTEPEVRAAVIKHRQKALGVNTPQQAAEAIDDEICKAVTDRLWLILLNRRQEELVISKKHLGWIRDRETTEGGY